MIFDLTGALNNQTALSVIILSVIIIAAVIAFFGAISTKSIKKQKKTAVTDPVTGCFNREGFFRAARGLVSDPKKDYSVAAVTIKNFLSIFQTFGHDASNRTLIHVYSVLSSVLSKAEPVGRISDDTFCFLIKNTEEDVIETRLKRVFETAEKHIQSGNIPCSLDLYFGIFIPDDKKMSAEEMLKKALSVLSSCENDSRYRFYKNSDDESPAFKWELASYLEQSLRAGDFICFMQPKVRLGDGRIVGAEALVRWRHPIRGTLAPDVFIPVLEEYCMMHLVDKYLFETVCKKLAEWKREGKRPCHVSVNISKENLKTEDFAGVFAKICHFHGLKTELFEFELSEDVCSESISTLKKAIDEIHSYGFSCSIDNFGKSRMPVHLLRELNIDTIKLDSNLFRAENNNQRNRFAIEAVLKVASQLQIKTVACGIDNESQIQYLRQAACDIVQGFYYFHPMSSEEFVRTAYLDGDLRFIEEEKGTAAAVQQTESRSNSNIVMFSLLAEEDKVEFSESFSPVLNGEVVFGSALSLFNHSDLIHENDRKDFFHLLARCNKDSGWVKDNLRFYTSEGHYEWMEVNMHKDVVASTGENIISCTLVNIAGWKSEVDRWKEKANRDALTGLFNREYFEQSSVEILSGTSVSSAAFVFIDIDDFKQVNDTLGHMIGDDVLCWFSKRILGIFRHTDIVARYGGDEFVVFANGITKENLEKRLSQLCEVFRYPYRNGEVEYWASGSIGAALYPDDGVTYRDLLDNADNALYTAKRQGKNQYVLYEPGMENPERDNK